MGLLKLFVILFVPTEFEDNNEQLPPETEQTLQKKHSDSADYKEESNPTGWPCSIYNLSYLITSRIVCLPFLQVFTIFEIWL